MADTPISLTHKTFTTGRTVVIGTTTLDYTLAVSGTNVFDVSRFEKMFNGIMEQALNLIQHAFDPDHVKGDCLAEAFSNEEGHGIVTEERPLTDEEILASLTNLPSA